MNNKLPLLSIVALSGSAALLIPTGCRSSTGMEGQPRLSAFSGFPGDNGASGVQASSSSYHRRQPVPEAVPVQTVTIPAAEPVPAPGAVLAPEPVKPVRAEPVATIPGPAPAEVSAEPKAVGNGHTYVVKSNDSLWVIAKREGVSIGELAEANGLKRNAVLKPGQKLTIPSASAKKALVAPEKPESAPGEIYVVRPGDSLSLIAHKFHVTSASLRDANGLKGDGIREGQKLKIPAGEKASAATASRKGAKAAGATGKVAGAASASGGTVATPAKPAPAPGNSGLNDVPMFGAPAPAPAAAPVPSSVAVPEPVEVTPVGR